MNNNLYYINYSRKSLNTFNRSFQDSVKLVRVLLHVLLCSVEPSIYSFNLLVRVSQRLADDLALHLHTPHLPKQRIELLVLLGDEALRVDLVRQACRPLSAFCLLQDPPAAPRTIVVFSLLLRMRALLFWLLGDKHALHCSPEGSLDFLDCLRRLL